jgi:hypothetical protein
MMSVFNNYNFKNNFNIRNFAILSISLLLSLLYVNNSSNVLVEAAEFSIFLPNEKPFGLTYVEWSAEWWKWLLSSPSDSNPSTDGPANTVI